jgi:hypothetical protein
MGYCLDINDEDRTAFDLSLQYIQDSLISFNASINVLNSLKLVAVKNDEENYEHEKFCSLWGEGENLKAIESRRTKRSS